MKNAQAKRYNHALKSAGISEHPVSLLDLDAFDSNVIALRERAGGVPIRIASSPCVYARRWSGRSTSQASGAFSASRWPKHYGWPATV